MIKNLLITPLISLIVSSQAFAHGEDKPGPHGGYIRMPGAFHTELVPTGKRELNAYLLDVSWQNPSVKDSKIAIIHQESKASSKCTKKSDLFQCVFPKSVDLTKPGKLLVNGTREGQKGNEVIYNLPLKFEPAPEGHEGSH